MRIRTILTTILVAAPGVVRACAVCTGADTNNKALGAAFNIGMTMLLGITLGLIGSGMVWFYRMEQRRKSEDARYIAELDRAAGWAAPAPSPVP